MFHLFLFCSASSLSWRILRTVPRTNSPVSFLWFFSCPPAFFFFWSLRLVPCVSALSFPNKTTDIFSAWKRSRARGEEENTHKHKQHHLSNRKGRMLFFPLQLHISTWSFPSSFFPRKQFQKDYLPFAATPTPPHSFHQRQFFFCCSYFACCFQLYKMFISTTVLDPGMMDYTGAPSALFLLFSVSRTSSSSSFFPSFPWSSAHGMLVHVSLCLCVFTEKRIERQEQEQE